MLPMEKSVTFTGACANEIIPSINCSFVYKAKEGRHVRIVICVCLCIVVSNTLCCVFLHLAYLLLPVYLDCPFGILQHLFTKQATQTPLKTEVHSSAPEGLAVHNLYLECNARLSLMFIYIYILSYYKLFLYFNLCLSVMSDSLPCSFTSISFLITSCSFTLICV